jgi:hypothetical protein
VDDGPDDALDETWHADLGLSLKAGSTSDFLQAMANVDRILSAVALDTADPYLGSSHVAGQVVDHMPKEKLACDLYAMWSELNDLHDFTAEDSAGERDVEAAIRDAASEWILLCRDDADAVRRYFDRWEASRDLALWRDRLGGLTFDSLDAAGQFNWDRS